jgi:hypothetical protein
VNIEMMGINRWREYLLIINETVHPNNNATARCGRKSNVMSSAIILPTLFFSSRNTVEKKPIAKSLSAKVDMNMSIGPQNNAVCHTRTWIWFLAMNRTPNL